MRNKKAIVAGALMAPALALTGGIAYASGTGNHPAPARPAVTTVQAHGQHPTGQARHDRCDWRCGDHWGDRRGHGDQGNGYQGGWGRGSGSHWGSGGGCCRHGW